MCIVAEPADGQAPAGVLRQVLFMEQLGPVLSPQLLATISHIQTQAWLDLPRLHSQTRPNAWATWAQVAGMQPTLKNAPITPNQQNYQHYYFALEAALRGQGVCVAPQHLVADDIASARLVAPLGFAPSGLAYVALLQADAKPAAKAFAQWLGEQVNS